MTTDRTNRFRPRNVGFKRLQFLTDFISAVHIEYNEIADFLGISRVAVSHWFAVDDIKLSQAFDIIEHFGYSLHLTMSRDIDAPEAQPADIEPDEVMVFPDGRYRLKRMSFLSFALRECGVTKKELATRMNLNYSSLRWMFNTDSMMISRLFQAAEALDCSVRFGIGPKGSAVSAGNGPDRHYIISINVLKDIQI